MEVRDLLQEAFLLNDEIWIYFPSGDNGCSVHVPDLMVFQVLLGEKYPDYSVQHHTEMF